MLAERLKSLRLEAKLSQKELSKELNISQQIITFYEQGKRNPKRETLEKFANFFNVSTDYLLGNTDIKNPEETISDVDMLFRRTSKDLTPEQQEVFKQELMEFMEMRRKAFEEDNK